MEPKARRNAKRAFVKSADALALLGIKPQTLYAYVSRGMIRSIADPQAGQRLYSIEDIERLRSRRQVRRGHAAAAADAIRWGQPVVPTWITDIVPAGPKYRGYAAIDLARQGHSFEGVAELLWTGVLPERGMSWSMNGGLEQHHEAFTLAVARTDSNDLVRAFAAIALTLGGVGGTTAAEYPGETLGPARCLLTAMAGSFGLLSKARRYVAAKEGEAIAAYLARSLGLTPDPRVCKAINAVLVLSADHELASATFSARVAASLGSDLHSCVLSALACHMPPLRTAATGGAPLGARPTAEELTEAVSARVTPIHMPVFNHPLYPKGDPRGTYLIGLARELQNRRGRGRQELSLLDYAANKHDLHPTILAAILAVCASLGVRDAGAIGLFLLGRTAGWIAHVMEQRLAGFVVRPRARFQLSRG